MIGSRSHYAELCTTSQAGLKCQPLESFNELKVDECLVSSLLLLKSLQSRHARSKNLLKFFFGSSWMKEGIRFTIKFYE